MATKKNTPTGYVIDSESAETGRLLSGVARKNRELYEQFKQMASTRGMKPSEAVEEAIRLWTLSKTLRDIDPETMIAAIDFVNYMREQSIRELLALGKLFTSEFFKVQMAIAKEVASQTIPQEPPTEYEKKPSPEDMIRQQLKLQMMQSMMPMLMNILKQMMGAFGGNANINIPQPNTGSVTQSSKKPIIVEE